MFIKKFSIKKYSTLEIIREIDFNYGINVISDKTENPKDSGNNVGKTLFIRLIKFCLGGDSDDLFKDRELNIEDTDLKSKIKDNYYFELILADDVFNSIKEYYLIRDLKDKNTINGNDKTKEEYKLAIRNILFGINQDFKKPTLGELLVKFFKVDIEQINNIFKINQGFTSNFQYEAMWLFLFGYTNTENLSIKSQIMDKIKKIKVNDAALDSLKLKLPILEEDLLGLKEKVKGIKLIDYVSDTIKDISQLQKNITSLKEEISLIDINRKYYEDQKINMDKATDINSEQIKQIYKSVNTDLPNLSQDFDKVINFYNSMVENKLKHIETQLNKYNKNYEDKKKVLDEFLEKEEESIKYLKMKKDFGEYENIQEEILEKSKEIESIETRISILQEATDEYIKLHERIKIIEKDIIFFKNKSYNDNITVFNRYFSKYTEEVLNEKYYVTFKESYNRKFSDVKEILLTIEGVKDTLSTGYKRGLIYLFDLAYLNFSIDKKLKVPFFFLHDQIESIYYSNIEKLFNLSNNVNGQCIVSLLSDKIKDFEIPVKPILELSQKDKLFRI